MPLKDSPTIIEMDHNIALIREHTKRLHILEMQEAQLGVRTDPTYNYRDFTDKRKDKNTRTKE